MVEKSKSLDKKGKAHAGKNRKSYITYSLIAILIVVLISLLLVKNLLKKKQQDEYATQNASSNQVQVSATFVGGEGSQGHRHFEEFRRALEH